MRPGVLATRERVWGAGGTSGGAGGMGGGAGGMGRDADGTRIEATNPRRSRTDGDPAGVGVKDSARVHVPYGSERATAVETAPCRNRIRAGPTRARPSAGVPRRRRGARGRVPRERGVARPADAGHRRPGSEESPPDRRELRRGRRGRRRDVPASRTRARGRSASPDDHVPGPHRRVGRLRVLRRRRPPGPPREASNRPARTRRVTVGGSREAFDRPRRFRGKPTLPEGSGAGGRSSAD